MKCFRILLVFGLCLCLSNFSTANTTNVDTPEVQSQDASKFAALQGNVSSLEASMANIEKRMASQDATISAQQLQIQSYHSKLDSQQRTITSLNEQLQVYQKQFNNQQNTVALLQSQVSNHWATIEQQRNALAIVKQDLTSEKIRVSSLEKKLSLVESTASHNASRFQHLLSNFTSVSTYNISTMASDINDISSNLTLYQKDTQHNISILANKLSNDYDQMFKLLEFQVNKTDLHHVQISMMQDDLHAYETTSKEHEREFMNRSNVLESEVLLMKTKLHNQDARLTSHQTAIDLHNNLLSYQANGTRSIFEKIKHLEFSTSNLSASLNLQHTALSSVQSTLATVSSNLSHFTAVMGSKVSFYAYKTNAAVQSIGKAMRFDHVVTNKGNNYNPSDGIFTCPLSGIYAFANSLDANKGNFITTRIIKNGAIMGYVQAVGTNTFDASGSSFVVLQLQKGDRVWVKIADHHIVDGSRLVYNGNYISFSGFLLY